MDPCYRRSVIADVSSLSDLKSQRRHAISTLSFTTCRRHSVFLLASFVSWPVLRHYSPSPWIFVLVCACILRCVLSLPPFFLLLSQSPLRCPCAGCWVISSTPPLGQKSSVALQRLICDTVEPFSPDMGRGNGSSKGTHSKPPSRYRTLPYQTRYFVFFSLFRSFDDVPKLLVCCCTLFCSPSHPFVLYLSQPLKGISFVSLFCSSNYVRVRSILFCFWLLFLMFFNLFVFAFPILSLLLSRRWDVAVLANFRRRRPSAFCAG